MRGARRLDQVLLRLPRRVLILFGRRDFPPAVVTSSLAGSSPNRFPLLLLWIGFRGRNRGIVGNVVGYTVYGDYSRPDPPSRIVKAVAAGEIDVAVVWGPLAGYFAPRQKAPLAIVPVSPQIDPPFLPFVWDISMGVRRGDVKLQEELDGILERRRPEIDALLDRYGVPRA